MKKHLCAIVALLCMAGAPGAWAALNKAAAPTHAPLTKEGYEKAKAAIQAQHAADRKACERVKAETKDLCQAQAEGRQKAERAALEARYQRTPEASLEARNVTADANYEVAREKCELMKRKLRKKCLQEAKAAREAALRHARVEKVETTGGIFGKGAATDAKASKVPGS
jgi:hypothetical protein